MSAAGSRRGAPCQVIVRAGRTVSPRTADAVLASAHRDDPIVVVVDRHDAGAAVMPSVLKRRATFVDDPSLLGQLVAEHADATGGPTVVVDDGAVGFGSRWLGDLIGALGEHGEHGAVVAATNGAPWPICPADVPDADASRSQQRELAKALSNAHGTDTESIDELDGVCVAISASAAPLVRALDTGDGDSVIARIGAAINRHGHTLAVAPGVYVHDERADVLLSACMIIKDEADNLERCLTSLRGVVDEVVIYDTGSTDGSIELARALGATVIAGYWDDDFSRARNAARAYCRGRWLLHIDADEEIEGAIEGAIGPQIRAMLATSDYDVIAINLFNMEGTELAPVRDPNPKIIPRLMRRTRCRWNGALHEHPVLVASTSTMPRGIHTNEIAVLHHGYLSEVVARKDKVARNNRIAATKLGELDDVGRLHFERARTLSSKDDVAGAVEEYARCVETADNPVHLRSALELGTQLLVRLGRYDEAATWIERRAAIGTYVGVAPWLRACLALAQNRNEDVLAALDGIDDYHDRYSTTGPDAIHNTRVTALARLGRYGEAGVELIEAFRANIAYDAAWFSLLQLAVELPDVVRTVAAMVPASQLKLLAGKLTSAPPIPADPIVDALLAAHPGSPELYVIAAQIAPHLELERAATWAIRLRTAGLAEYCPLRAIAATEMASPVRRLQAAHLGAELFDDAELRDQVATLSTLLPAG